MGQGIPDAGFKAIAGLGFMQPKPGAPDNPFVELGVNRYLIDLPRSEGVTGRIILDPSAEDTKDFVELPNANADEIFGTAAPPDTVPGCLGPLVDGCSSRALAAPRRGGVLKAAFSADPAGFDPVRGPSGMSHVVIEQVYSTLMALDPEAKPYPELAESYAISDDGLQYTFKLRSGVTFHNGDELTAEDVKFSFDRLRAKDSGYSYTSQIETIDAVDVVDKLTVLFKLTKRTGPFLVYMAFPGSSIVPKKLVESGYDLNAKPIGSGPFKFVSYEPRSAIKFERNANYFQEGKPYFDAMEYRIISDITALANAVASGEVNFSNEIPPKDWASMKANASLTTQTLEGSRYYWMLINNTVKPLDNPKVRQAIGLAIDVRRSWRARSSVRPRRSAAASFPSGTGAMPTPNSSARRPSPPGRRRCLPRPGFPMASRPLSRFRHPSRPWSAWPRSSRPISRRWGSRSRSAAWKYRATGMKSGVRANST